jgi:Short C-terminal domain
LEQLQKLNELKLKGLLTEEEFATQKNKLMN